MSDAGTAALSWVADTNVVVSTLAFHKTTSPDTKFAPVTVSVNAVPPAVALVGDMEFRVGGGALMEKLSALVVPPPLGPCTTTVAVPALAIRLAETLAVSCVADTNAVLNALPFQRTRSPETKFAPLTVKVNPVPPAAALEGEIELSTGGAGLITKLSETVVPPPGAWTATVAVPTLAIRLDGTAAVSCVPETKDVLRGLPFHNTLSPDTKFAPIRVSEKAVPPAVALAGEIEVRAGAAGALMVKLSALVVVPPFDVSTATLAVPGLAIKVAGTAAVNCPAVTNEVDRVLPFHSTKSPETKFDPVTVRLNAAPPAVVVVGEMELKIGEGVEPDVLAP